MQFPAASLSFILQRERFVSAYSSLSAIYAGRNIAKLLRQSLVPPLIAFESLIYFHSDGNQRYLYFFQPHRFRQWFLSDAGFAAPGKTACARNRKRRKCVAHETENNENETRRVDRGIYFAVECFITQNLRGNYQASQLNWKKHARDGTSRNWHLRK